MSTLEPVGRFSALAMAMAVALGCGSPHSDQVDVDSGLPACPLDVLMVPPPTGNVSCDLDAGVVECVTCGPGWGSGDDYKCDCSVVGPAPLESGWTCVPSGSCP